MPDQSQETEVFSYGEHPDQYVSLMHPDRRPSAGTAVLVHGGYWRQRITAGVMQPLVDDLLRSGWSVANVEYRRGPEHSWPIPSLDTAKAIALVRGTLRRQGRPDTVILIGHSVGGQLALLNSGLATAVIALAPVTDAAKVHAEGLGEDAAKEYFGGSPAEIPAIYRMASPIQALPPEVPMLLVHGANDDRVPLEHTRQYVLDLAGKARPDQMFHQQLDHFEIIDPQQHHWQDVRSWMGKVLADARAE
ncbi:alpha/beta hydrolase family protein [Glutamicibacter protophormiae]|uniref:alpha/beta hydrolase family protein n=1 Tax=Glutamicibacter protophormiae TaxID=37930 RepID=UPI003A909C9B